MSLARIQAEYKHAVAELDLVDEEISRLTVVAEGTGVKARLASARLHELKCAGRLEINTRVLTAEAALRRALKYAMYEAEEDVETEPVVEAETVSVEETTEGIEQPEAATLEAEVNELETTPVSDDTVTPPKCIEEAGVMYDEDGDEIPPPPPMDDLDVEWNGLVLPVGSSASFDALIASPTRARGVVVTESPRFETAA